MKKRIIIFLLALHLVILFLGTSLFDFGYVPGVLQQPIGYYLSIVGGHNYSFFSPDIPAETIVRCDVIYKDGQTRTVEFGKSNNTFDLRSTYLFQLLSDNHDFETAARIAARYCFAQSPAGTSKVKVSIGTWIVPSIEDHKAGKPCTFSELYSEDFTHE